LGVPTNLPSTNQSAKPAHKSATVWLNSLVALGSLLVMVDPATVQDWTSRYVHNADLAVQVTGLVMAALGVVNVLLRIYKTKQPVAH